MAVLALATGLGWGWGQTEPPASLELRLFIHASMTTAELAHTRVVTEALMAPARVPTTWVDCDNEAARCQQQASRVVQVLLMPFAKRIRPGVCGEVVREMTTALPTLIVYVGCARAVIDDVRFRARHPRLLSLRAGDIVGLTLAHELGHLWGLTHSATGLMKARHDADDLVELPSKRLSLAPDEARRLARAIRDGQALYVRH